MSSSELFNKAIVKGDNDVILSLLVEHVSGKISLEIESKHFIMVAGGNSTSAGVTLAALKIIETIIEPFLTGEIICDALGRVLLSGTPDVYDYLMRTLRKFPTFSAPLLKECIRNTYDSPNGSLLEHLVKKAGPKDLPSIECAARVSDEQLRRFVGCAGMTPLPVRAITEVLRRDGDHKEFIQHMSLTNAVEALRVVHCGRPSIIDFLKLVINHFHLSDSQIESKVIRLIGDADIVRVFLMVGYVPSTNVYRAAITGGHVETVKLFMDPPVGKPVKISDPTYWGRVSVRTVMKFIDAGITLTDEIMREAILRDLHLSSDLKYIPTLVPHVKDKSALLDGCPSDGLSSSVRWLIELGVVPTQQSLTAAMLGYNLKKVKLYIETGLKPSVNDLTGMLPRVCCGGIGHDQKFPGYLIEKAGVAKANEITELILRTVQSGNVALFSNIVGIFPEADYYEIILDAEIGSTGSVITVPDIAFLMKHTYVMQPTTETRLIERFGSLDAIPSLK